jgi:hypothetical protein
MRVLRLTCALLAAAALLAGCSDDESRPESPGTPTVTAQSTSPSPTPSRPAPSTRPSSGPAGTEGFTVRYLDRDGNIQTLQPKDFPR